MHQKMDFKLNTNLLAVCVWLFQKKSWCYFSNMYRKNELIMHKYFILSALGFVIACKGVIQYDKV